MLKTVKVGARIGVATIEANLRVKVQKVIVKEMLLLVEAFGRSITGLLLTVLSGKRF